MIKRIVTITGPTCSGKSTLARELTNLGIPELVSTTTRERREGELDGRDYHFVSDLDFDELQASGQIIQMVNLNGCRYGTDQKEINRHEGRNCVVVEPTGVSQYRRWAATQEDVQVLAVYVENTLGTLTERLLCRFADDNNAVLENYCMRMRNLVETEFNGWSTMVDYDLHIGRYDLSNREGMAKEIALAAQTPSHFLSAFSIDHQHT